MSDGHRFDSTADHYARHRPGYGDDVIDRLCGRFGIDADHDGDGDSAADSPVRVLDLGCGTGELAIPLATHADEVVAVDPSPAMCAATRERAAAASSGLGTVRVIEGDDTDVGDLEAASGPFRLTTMGRSFHRTDGAATLDRIREETEPGGGVALVTDPEWLTRGTEDWQDEVYAVAARHVDALPERTGPVAYDRTWADHLRDAGFTDVRVETVDEHRALDADGVVGYVLSLSFCSPEELGDGRAAFESDLRARLAALGGPFEYDRTVEVTSGMV